MSGFSSSTRDQESTPQTATVDRRSTSMDVGTNNDQASSWGNGVMAEAIRSVEGPMQSPSIGDSFSGITRDLADGPSFGTNGAGRTFTDWFSGAAGGAYGGDINAGGPFSWSGGFGAGVGGGGGTWEQSHMNEKTGWERTASGVGGSVAVGGRVDSEYQANGSTLGASGDVYRGVGGNAYSFNDVNQATGESRTGYGVDGNYTPLGFNDASVSASNEYGSAEVTAGNIEVGRTGGFGEAYQTGDGGYGIQGGVNMGRNTATDVNASIDSPLGQTDAHIGSIGQGRFHQGGIEVGPDGSVMGNYSRGGSLSIQDASITNTGPLGTTEASIGSYGGVKTSYAGGYDATENRIVGSHTGGKAKVVTDAEFSQTLAGGGSIEAGAGRIQNGSRYDGSGYIDLDDGSAHVEGNAEYGGVVAQDVNFGAGWDGIYRQDVHADTISNATTIEGAHADYADGQLSAGVDHLRTGGFRVQGVEGSSQIGGVTNTYGVNEVSNDVKLDGAYATVDENGANAGFQELDFGGVRVDKAHFESDLGGHGNLEAGGSFGNGNNLKGGNVSVTENGVDASLDSFAVAGVDVNDAYFRAEGPGGTHVDAGLGAYHSGVSGDGVTAHVGADGVSVGADNLAYDAHSIRDLHVNSGIDGVYEQNLSVGSAGMHQARISDLRASVDATGANLSVGESSYDFATVSDLQASQSFGDGAVGTEVGIGEASYLGGGVGSAEYQSNFLEGTSSLNATDVNLHGLTAEDVNVGVNVGDANVGVGADSLSVIDANIGALSTESSNFGLTQSGTATDVDIGLLRAENLNAGIGWGDQNILSATTDIDASVGADRVDGAFDLTQGTASGAIENGRVTAMTDASIGIGDYNLDPGRTGVDANVNAAGEIDVFNGTASGQASLAGTELSAFGYSTELGDWAQASGDVDVSRGAVNANIGGENGVGVNASIAEGNLDVNIGGYEIDVDQGIRDAGSAIADGASYVGGKVSDAWDSITSW